MSENIEIQKVLDDQYGNQICRFTKWLSSRTIEVI